MLSIDDNIYMTQVDRGSAMGDFLRLFWVPALLSSELPGPDCAPIRVTLLGEKLIAFPYTELISRIIVTMIPRAIMVSNKVKLRSP